VHGALANLKITSPEDLVLAESLTGYDSMDSRMRVGIGYDVHALVSGRRLVLGGLEIPHNLGLDGHSDADVIIHALCDALLGAAGLPDIGANFPDTDPQWAGVRSLDLLELVGEKIRSAGFDLVNADLTLMAEKPKIKNYVPEMARLMAEVLSTEPDHLNIKGTTTEGLGLVGREEGMAASAVVLLSRKSEW
jgi:2-C-methyl-D-erythritol 2,4-cyclodiphosphate synthase